MPTPTAEEIEQTREVLGLKSYQEVQTLIESLQTVQWDAQLEDNSTFFAKRNSSVEIRGADGAFIDPVSFTGKIRNRSRQRFGLTAIGGKGTDYDLEEYGSSGVISSLKWF